MKISGVQTKFLAVAVTAGLLSGFSVLNAAPTSASVSAIVGQAAGVQEGDALPAGSVVSTGSSKVVLEIDGDQIVVQEDSTLALDRLDVEESSVGNRVDIGLNLTAGSVSGVLSKKAALSKFVVRIPKGQVTIDVASGPATFLVSANGDVQVATGSADVTFNRGTIAAPATTTVRLAQGQVFNPVTGTVVTPPSLNIPPPPVQPTVAVPTQPTQPFTFFVSPNLPGSSSQ